MPETLAFYSTKVSDSWHQKLPSTVKQAKWKQKSNDAFTASGGEADKDHAERLAFTATAAANQGQQVFLFVQDEFPCEKCQAFFLKLVSTPFIFVCHTNKVYAGVWDLTNPPLPQVIYLYKGKISMPGKIVVSSWVAPNAATPWIGSMVSTTTLQAVNPDACERPQDFPEHPSLSRFLTG